MEFVRRILFAAAMFGIAALLYSYSRGGRDHYGLADLLNGKKPPPDKVAGAKIELDDIQVVSRMNREFSKISAAVLPSVVSVSTKTEKTAAILFDPLNGARRLVENVPGIGSGVIISPEGLVVTNFHVIQGVANISITTHDDVVFPATVLGYDVDRDIAVLRIEGAGHKFPALSFANSDEVNVGQIVFAVGNPFGLSGTVTQGIISARNRHLSDSQPNYLQTDTVINPGNSGGPLVNIQGQVIGINVALYRGDANVRSWQGVGLAIPANDAKMVVDAITASQKKITRLGNGYLGLEVVTEPVRIDPTWNTSRNGALVRSVDPGSPADKAGIHPGDVITKFQGMAFQTPAGMLDTIRRQPPGSQVTLEILRADGRLKIPARIGPRPEM